jgi:histidinol-phosphate aminotransferase
MINRYPNLVILQTFSKAMAKAGIRLGMCFASKEIINILNKIKPPYNINTLTQQAAFEVLRTTKVVSRQVAVTIKQRKLLAKKLIQFNFVKTIYPSDANFLLIKTTNAKRLYNYLLLKEIVVRDRSSAPLCSGCLRITVGTPEENQVLLNALESYEDI